MGKFAELISKFGENGRLYTFDYCSNYGVELGYSTIDAITFKGGYGGIAFYFNENTDDYAMFGDFALPCLEEFYTNLLYAIAKKSLIAKEETEETSTMVYVVVSEVEDMKGCTSATWGVYKDKETAKTALTKTILEDIWNTNAEGFKERFEEDFDSFFNKEKDNWFFEDDSLRIEFYISEDKLM